MTYEDELIERIASFLSRFVTMEAKVDGQNVVYTDLQSGTISAIKVREEASSLHKEVTKYKEKKIKNNRPHTPTIFSRKIKILS